jgi:RNA polymerase sigma-70 factor (sigma-E family)
VVESEDCQSSRQGVGGQVHDDAGPPAGGGDDARDREVAWLFRHRYGELVRLAYLLTSDNALAEELVQEAFVATWRSWDKLRATEAAYGYLRATLVNLARMSLRRRMLELRHRIVRPEPVTEPDPSGELDLARAVAALPMGKRACIVLRYFADLSEEETARLLGVSVGTVKSSTHRALRDLERRLGRGLDDRAAAPRRQREEAGDEPT